MAAILGIVFVVIYFVAAIAAGGYTLSTLWNDFIPQIFPALPSLNFYQALAVSLVMGLFTVNTGKIYSQDDEIKEWKQMVNLSAPFLRYGLALLMGMWLKTHLG